MAIRELNTPPERRVLRVRSDWDSYYLDIAANAATRASCDAAQVGCVVVSAEQVVIGTGYNGAPSGFEHCEDVGCHWVERFSSTLGGYQRYERHVHAEANVISRAARVGTRLAGATMYVTQEPCPECLKLCVQAGIATIVVGTVLDRKWFEVAANACYDVLTLRERYGLVGEGSHG